MAQRRLAVAAASTSAATGTPRGSKGTIAPKTAAPKTAAAPARDEDDKARKRREADERQRRTKALGPLEKQVASLEARIAELEAAQKVRSTDLADPAVYADDARRRALLAGFQEAQDKLDDLNPRWEAAMIELEAARAALAG